MTFLIPALLFGLLPLAILPIIIHLVNRMRYKPMKWAATYFLSKAKKSSTKMAKLREFLILACRVLAIVALAAAIGRPLAGGWLGWAASGEPDTVLVVLDRSASMRTVDPGHSFSRLQRNREVVLDAARKLAGKADLIVLDSATGREVHLKDLEMLNDETLFGETDTAANVPALLNQAATYIRENDCGQAEIWVASDMQASNWKAEDASWQMFQNEVKTLPSEVKIRTLGLVQTEESTNMSIEIRSAELDESQGLKQLKIQLKIHAPSKVGQILPITFNLGGNDEIRNIEIRSEDSYISEYFTLTEGESAIRQGAVSLPKDLNPSDNTAFFAFATQSDARIISVSDKINLGRFHAWLANPLAEEDKGPETLDSSGFESADLSQCSLLILCDGPFENPSLNKKVLTFIEAGGIVVAYPAEGDNESSLAGVTWGASELSRPSRPYRVGSWRTEHGPLSRASSGVNLSLDKLEIKRLRPFASDAKMDNLASLEDERGLVGRVDLGQGSLFCLATRLDKTWSSLHEGTVLLPFYHRLAEMGLRNYMKIRQAEPAVFKDSGKFKQLSGKSGSAAVKTLYAGVYQHDEQYFVLNSPMVERDMDIIAEDKLLEITDGLNFTYFDTQQTASEGKDSHAEMWKFFLILMLILLVGEALLTLRRPQVQIKKEA